MRIGNTTTDWGAVQQVLHWATFLLVLAQVWFGLSLAAAMPGDPDGRAPA
ncbi:hypothetical protein STVA_28420 [Allostella vacuolata]|nr:hypothetical protein STVA_28420 [Stella vacuolata]